MTLATVPHIVVKTTAVANEVDKAFEIKIDNYSKSFDFGFRPGSFDKKPKIKRETKKITTV